MQEICNCCHGMLDARILFCSDVTAVQADEEVIGESLMEKTADHMKPCDSKSSSSRWKEGVWSKGFTHSASAKLCNDLVTAEESPRTQLQRLIREFAVEVVGRGIRVEVKSQQSGGTSMDSPDTFVMAEPQQLSVPAVLKMDRRISRIELWPLACLDSPERGREGITPLIITLHDVVAIVATSGEGCSLSIVRNRELDVSLIFQSSVMRDRAFRCLRIFQMSVDHSQDSAGDHVDMTDSQTESVFH